MTRAEMNPPEQTELMKDKGLVWAKTESGNYIMVCNFCGGNCGQCGLTDLVGNAPASFSQIVSSFKGRPLK